MWLLIGAVLGAGLAILILWLRSQKITLKWYEWLIGAAGIGILFYMIRNVSGSLADNEARAAVTFLWLLGAPAIVLLAIASLLLWRRHRKAR
jgi:hypothetical protein